MGVSNGAVSFLAASANRVAALLALRESGAGDLRSVAEEVDASRRTVKRTLDALEERGWVITEDENGEYRISSLGALVLESYLDVVDRLEAADRLAPFLEQISVAELGLSPMALADAEVVVKAENQPYAPMDRVLEIRRNASEIREVVNIVQGDSAAQLRERVERGELEAEIVLEDGVLEAISANEEYADEFEATLGTDGVRFYVYDDTIPFVFGLMDDTVILGVNDDMGMPEAVVVSEAPAVREWAHSRFESYRSAASELEPDGW